MNAVSCVLFLLVAPSLLRWGKGPRRLDHILRDFAGLGYVSRFFVEMSQLLLKIRNPLLESQILLFSFVLALGDRIKFLFRLIDPLLGIVHEPRCVLCGNNGDQNRDSCGNC